MWLVRSTSHVTAGTQARPSYLRRPRRARAVCHRITRTHPGPGAHRSGEEAAMRHHLPWTRASRHAVRSIVVLGLASFSFGTSGERGDAVSPAIAVDDPTTAWADQVAWGIDR